MLGQMTVICPNTSTNAYLPGGSSHHTCPCRYELYSISRPATLDAYLAYPLLRYYQKAFREASIAVVKKALEKDETVDAAMRMWDTMKMG